MCLILHSIESFATDLNGHRIKLIPVSMELWVCTEVNTRAKWRPMTDCTWLFFLVFMSTGSCPVAFEIGENRYIAKAATPGMFLRTQVSASALSWPHPWIILATYHHLDSFKEKEICFTCWTVRRTRYQNMSRCAPIIEFRLIRKG